MNQAQCHQCGRAVSEADRAGGSCPWCGRVLTVPHGYAPKPSRRSAPAARTPRSDSRGTSGWSYWWIPLVAFMAIKGMSSCGRMQHNSSNGYTPREVYKPTEFDVERFREMLEQQREASPDEFDFQSHEEAAPSLETTVPLPHEE